MATTPVEEMLQRFHTATGPDAWKIRRECATALEELFATESPSALAQRFTRIETHDYQLQIAMVHALDRSNHPEAVATLRQLETFALNHPVDDAIRQALTSYFHRNYSQESIDTLLKRYDLTSGLERSAIIIALEDLFPQEGTDRLLQRFTERAPETGFKIHSRIHVAIADALHETFLAESIEVLLQRLTQLPDSTEAWRIESSLFAALEVQFQQETVATLVKRFDQADGLHAQRLQSTLVKALAAKADRGAVLPLVQRLPHVRCDEAFYVQLDIIDALGKLGDSRAIEPLLAWFDKPDSYFIFDCDRKRETMVLCQRIVAALGTLGDPIALEPIQARMSYFTNHDWSLERETLQKTLSTLKAKRFA